MSIPLRSLADVLAIFRATEPKKKLKSFPGLHYAALEAHSFGNLASWPRRPPVPVLASMRDPQEHDERVLQSAAALVSYANFGAAIGTWNASGSADWTGGDGWIIASVDLSQEQAEDGYEGPGDYVSLLLGLWRLSDGWAAAVLRSGERELMARLVGLEGWPEQGWKTEAVWYGE